jgi:hypothetical protein
MRGLQHIAISDTDLFLDVVEYVKKLVEKFFEKICLMFVFLEFRSRGDFQSSDDFLQVLHGFYLGFEIFGIHTGESRNVKRDFKRKKNI